MKVGYVFRNNMASTFQLATMILPQLEQKLPRSRCCWDVFFDDNIFCLKKEILLVRDYQKLLMKKNAINGM